MIAPFGLDGGEGSGRSSSAGWNGSEAGAWRDGEGEWEASEGAERGGAWEDMNREGNKKESTIPMK